MICYDSAMEQQRHKQERETREKKGRRRRRLEEKSRLFVPLFLLKETEEVTKKGHEQWRKKAEKTKNRGEEKEKQK